MRVTGDAPLVSIEALDRLVKFLKERLDEYEKDYGEIKVEEEKS